MNLTFNQALTHMKNGLPMQRVGWNGKGMFVFMQVPSNISIDIIPKMQSLPQSVKDIFQARGTSISYSNQFAIVHSDNKINGWIPSSSDLLAEDWQTATV